MAEGISWDDAESAETLVNGPATSGADLTSTRVLWCNPSAVAEEVGRGYRAVHDFAVTVE